MVSITAVLVSRFLLDLQEVDQDVRGQGISLGMSNDVISESVQFAAFIGSFGQSSPIMAGHQL